jgi:23S rRNA pseudouridine1911/1915/1917 synthase
MEDTNIFIASEEDEKTRIDKFLAKKFTLKSRSYFQYLIENECVHVNNKKIKKRALLKKGDEIEIFFLATPEISLTPENIPLDILYEDDYIIVINKPKDMVVHPAPGNYSHTFVNALLYHCKNLDNSDSIRPGIVHRLDKNTTGVLIAAKTSLSHQRLIEIFQKREIKKTYLALCIGKPEEGIINMPIKRHPIKRKEMTVSEDGKEAISEITILQHKNNISLVSINILTGRTHQIRVHLKHLNCPILGDDTYGSKHINEKYKIFSQQLHAHEISFIHPINKILLNIKAPLPCSMQKTIQYFFE